MEPPYGFPSSRTKPQPAVSRPEESPWASGHDYFPGGSLPSLEALSPGAGASFPSHMFGAATQRSGSLPGEMPSGQPQRPNLPMLNPLPSTPMANFDTPPPGHIRSSIVGGTSLGAVESVGLQLRPLEVIPLFDVAFKSTSIIPALSRPAFARDGSGRFVCGTEEQHPHRVKSNNLVFGRVDPNTGKLMQRNGAPDVWTQPITNHVRDIQWVDEQLLIVAIASTLVLIRLPQQRTDMATINFPPFHKDIIREIAVSPAKRNLLLSGGFDGSVFVTDISRLCEDITSDQQQSENSIYP